MEVTVGLNHGKQTVEPLTQADLERNDRTNVGLSGLPQFYPEANPSRIVPNADFGVAGLALPAQHGHARRRGPVSVLRRERYLELVGEPDQGVGLAQHEGGDLLRVHDAAGRALEPVQRRGSISTAIPRTRSMRDHPYANALLGSVNSYNEATSHPDANAQFTNFEWFIQDSWRVQPNLTIDGGIRFYRIGPTQSRGDQLAVFQPDTFNPANAPLLIQPVNTADGRRGINPLTGEILPAVKIGTFVPDSGNPTNGTQVYDESILNTPAIQVAPRIGFAWDVTADGRTAVRGGFGIFPDRFNDDIVLQHRGTAAARHYRRRPTTRRSANCCRRRSASARRRRAPSIRTTSRSRSRTGASACSAISASSWWPTSLRRIGRAQAAADEEHQRRAVRRELPAVRTSTRRRAARCRPTSCGLSWLRRHPPQRVRRLLRLPRAADLGEPTLHAGAALRRCLHAALTPRTSGRRPRRTIQR